MKFDDKPRERRDAGYVSVAVAGSLVIFCGMLGLAADVGMLYFQRSHMRAAADSAAMAAAFEMFRGNTSSVRPAARTDATSNAYTNGVNGATVTVNRPPLSGDHTSDSDYVEVIVARDEPTYFMSVLGINSVHVSARAVAGGGNSEKCLYILSPSAPSALLATGGSTVNVSCAIVDNSTDSTAVNASGGGCINASAIYVTGTAKSGGCYSPTPITGVAPSDDPLQYLTPPTVVGSCIATNYTINGGTASLTPGTYCHTGSNPAILIQGGAKVTLAPGTYILKGGGLSVNGNFTRLNGTGVTIYNTCNIGSCARSTTGYGAILFLANADLSAPTSGSLNNVLFFVDRSAPANFTNTFSAGAIFNLTGTLYAKTQEIFFSGGSATTSLNINIVSNTLTFAGSSNLTLTHSFGGGGSAIKKVVMVE